jgi:hypothetical protein
MYPLVASGKEGKKIEELAIQKYRTCGQGIDFSDVMEFRCSKANAQRILKDCCMQRILFRSPKRTGPQRYYPSIIKALRILIDYPCSIKKEYTYGNNDVNEYA